MSGNPDYPDRAGEYVLGVMRGAERRAFEAEFRKNPALAAEVAAWERRLLPLALSIPAAPPPPQLWTGIETAIAPAAIAPAAIAPAAIAPAAAARRPLAQTPPRRGGLWRSLFFWRGFGLAAAAAAIILAILRPSPLPPAPNLVALLQATPEAGPSSPSVSPIAFTIALRPDGALAVAPVSTRHPPQGKAWELWAIAPSAKPVPIGVISVRHTTEFKPGKMPVVLREPHVLIAVSVEPPGGSPTGQPTGPVVFTGPLLRLE